MRLYRSLLRNEMAIDTINAKIYAREKIIKEYEGIIKQFIYNPKRKYQPEINDYINIKLKAMNEIALLNKIKKNLVKGNIAGIKEIACRRELRLIEIRTLYHAINNLN